MMNGFTHIYLWIRLFFLFYAIKLSHSAQIKVATFETNPFVVSTDNVSLTGYSVALWEDIATIANIDYVWVIYPGIADALDAIQNGTADVAICDISITEARAEIMDFSQPILDSGLQIMIYGSKTRVTQQANQILASLFSKLFWEVLGLFFLVIIVLAHIFYVIERKRRAEESAIRKGYQRGGFEDSLWWASNVLFTGGGQLMPATAWGRLLTFLAIIVSCILVSIMQATITAQLTVSSLNLNSGIRSVNDLVGLRVGVVSGSTGQIYLSQVGGITLVGFNNANELLQAFTAKTDGLDAAFDDAPIFKYYINNQGQSIGKLVGIVYEPQQYGIAFPIGSPVRTEVNVALLNMEETGSYFQLKDQYFSSESSGNSESNILTPTNASLGITWGLVGASFLFVFCVLTFRCCVHKKKQKKKPKLEPVSSVELYVIDQEINVMIATLEDLSQKLHRLKQAQASMTQSQEISRDNTNEEITVDNNGEWGEYVQSREV